MKKPRSFLDKFFFIAALPGLALIWSIGWTLEFYGKQSDQNKYQQRLNHP